MTDLLKIQPLTRLAFAPYGDIISTAEATHIASINQGNTQRFDSLASLCINPEKGTPCLSIFRSSPLPLPITICSLENHPLSSQAFFPLSKRPFLVVVAPPGELDESRIEAFLAGPEQGVNYHPGTWHHYSLALQETSDFLVIDCHTEQPNCDEVNLATPRQLQL
jgi:ureidoglycolate lyase